NKDSVSFTVTLSDTIRPTLITKNITVYLDVNSGAVSIGPSDVNNGSFDNCSLMLDSVVPNTFYCDNIGNNIVTLYASDGHGNYSSASAIVNVQYATPPLVTAVIAHDTTCNGQQVDIHLLSNITATNFTWTVVAHPDLSGYSNGSAANDYHIKQNITNNGDSVRAIVYIIVPTIYNRCVLPTIYDTIYVNPTPRIIVAADDTLCNNGSTTFSITNPNTVRGVWRYDIEVTYPAGVSGTLGDKTNQTVLTQTDNLINTTNDVQAVTYRFIPHINPGDGGLECGAGVETTLVVYVNPTVHVLFSANADTICNNSRINIGLSSNETVAHAIRYRYYLIDMPDSVQIYMGQQSNLSPGATIRDSVVNNTNFYKTFRYVVQPYIVNNRGLEICTGVPDTFVVVVNPTPILYVSVSETVLCDSSEVYFTVTSPTVATGIVRYNLQTIYTPGAVNGVQSDGEYVPGNFTNKLINKTLSYQNITYRFRPFIERYQQGGNCTDAPLTTIVLSLNPTPQVSVTSSDTLYCNSSDVTLEVTSLNGVVLGDKQYYIETQFDTSKLHITGTLSGYLPIQSLTHRIVNNTTQMQVVTYRLTPVFHNPTGNIPGSYCSMGKVVIVKRYILPSVDVQLIPKTYAGGWNEPCYGDTLGEIYVDLKGGMRVLNMPLTAATYQWQRNGSSWVIRHDTLLRNLPIGAYLLRVTDTHGCYDTASIVLREPTKLEVSTQVISGVECTGISTGKIVAKPRGGTPGYSYVWTFGPTKVVGYKDTVTNCVFGTYHVTVTDQNNCKVKTTQIFDPADAFLAVYTNPLYYGNYNISCPGASDGGFRPTKFASDTVRYFYQWSRIENGVPVWTRSTPNGDIFDLPKGVYRLTVTNTLGCFGEVYDTLREPTPVNIQAIISSPYGDSINLRCHDSRDGSIQLNVSGGHGNYKYLWQSPLPMKNVTRRDQDSLDAGEYIVTVMDTAIRYTDLAILTYTCTYRDTFHLFKPDSLRVDFEISDYNGYNTSCYQSSDGWINVTAQGGKGTYSYRWTSPPSAVVLSDSSQLLNVGAGSYRLNLVYGNNCSYSWDLTLTQPDSIYNVPVISKYADYHVSCYGDSNGYIRSQIRGGLSPYQYEWFKNTTFLSSSQDIVNVGAGNYNLVVTDRNGCKKSWNYTLVEPPIMRAELFANSPSCAGMSDGRVGVRTITGGVAPYKYMWNTTSQQHEDTVMGVPKGTYTVTIMDSLNCSITRTITVTEPSKLEVAIDFDTLYHGSPISCFNASDARIKATAKGGTQPYAYSWQEINTGRSNYPTTEVLTALGVGRYKVQVVDKNNCIAESPLLTIIQPDTLQVEIIPTHLRCYNDYSGSAIAVVKGGTRPYRYYWQDIISDSAIVSLAAGLYQLRVEDINGCIAMGDITINQPDSLRVVIQGIEQPYCPATYDGEIQIKASGGTQPYVYDWDNGMGGDKIVGLREGPYVYMLTDAHGCQVSDTVELKAQMPDCIDIPKAFSPNGDGINDTWNILVGDPANPLPLSAVYPKAIVEVYNRWGVLVYRSDRGYTKEWDGRSRFKQLPPDSYYYSIDLGNGSKRLIGIVSIVR
ncbi:MAG TPA: gliding motility-associated C-terminal domain-containing protein, partial [Bacteroidales bacterium]|nr:gliding motility-associated C-terminal domain-containing protein [Bacteroidales bacterium]